MSEDADKGIMPKIELTEEMISAGADYIDRMFLGWDMNTSPITCREWAENVFKLMMAASRSQPR